MTTATLPKRGARLAAELAKGHERVRIWSRGGFWWLSRRAQTASCDCPHSRETFRLVRDSQEGPRIG